jgi:hypothetical protein
MAQHPTDRIASNYPSGDQRAGHPQASAGEGALASFLREVDSAGAHVITGGTSESAFAQAPLPPEKAHITHIDTGNQEALYKSVFSEAA